MPVYICVRMYACMCMYASMLVCMCMYVCIYVCMHAYDAAHAWCRHPTWSNALLSLKKTHSPKASTSGPITCASVCCTCCARAQWRSRMNANPVIRTRCGWVWPVWCSCRVRGRGHVVVARVECKSAGTKVLEGEGQGSSYVCCMCCQEIGSTWEYVSCVAACLGSCLPVRPGKRGIQRCSRFRHFAGIFGMDTELTKGVLLSGGVAGTRPPRAHILARANHATQPLGAAWTKPNGARTKYPSTRRQAEWAQGHERGCQPARVRIAAHEPAGCWCIATGLGGMSRCAWGIRGRRCAWEGRGGGELLCAHDVGARRGGQRQWEPAYAWGNRLCVGVSMYVALEIRSCRCAHVLESIMLSF